MNTSSYYNARLRKFALGRLEQITTRRQEKSRQIAHLRELGMLTWGEENEYRTRLRLLDRAIYSVYLDCMDAGAGEEARSFLDELRQVVPNAALAA